MNDDREQLRPIFSGNNVIVTAHPDDETLWCGGLPIVMGGRWTVICCSIPRRDPVRAWKLHDACDVLGAQVRLMPLTETTTQELLGGLEVIDLSGYDAIVTHNSMGEYGHLHHKQIHAYLVSRNAHKPIFTLGVGDVRPTTKYVRLTEDELERKMMALKMYDHVLPYEGQMITKWEALIQRYVQQGDVDLAVEGYNAHTA